MAQLMAISERYKNGPMGIDWKRADREGALDTLKSTHTYGQILARYSYEVGKIKGKNRRKTKVKQPILPTPASTDPTPPARWHFNHCPNCGCPLKGAEAGLKLQSSMNA